MGRSINRETTAEPPASVAEPAACESTAASVRGRPWQPGQSGNPKGRPTGSKNKVKELCAQLLGEESVAIMNQLITKAKEGSPMALRLCVDRLLPAQASRDRSVVIELPAMEKAVDLVKATAAVISHVASGDITLSEGNDVMKLLDAERRAIETHDISVRLEAIELKQRRESGEEEQNPSLQSRVRRVLVREFDDADNEIGGRRR